MLFYCDQYIGILPLKEMNENILSSNSILSYTSTKLDANPYEFIPR